MSNKSLYGVPTLKSNETLQHLDAETKLKFNQFWQVKEIIGKNPKTPICKHVTIDDPSTAIRTRPRLYMTPGISLDNITDKNTREKLIKYIYSTTKSRDDKEIWNNPEETNKAKCVNVFEESANPFSFHPSSLQALPKEVRLSAKKWDAEQHRYLLKECPRELSFMDKDLKTFDKMGNYITSGDEPELRTLHRKHELRSPYVKLPPSYGGFRSTIAKGVPLQKKELSIYDPQMPVSKTLTKRLKNEGKINN